MPTTLESINESIMAVGQSPLNVSTSSRDYQIVSQMLTTVSRRVQTKGWHFNTEKCVPMVRDGNNKIPVADNVLDMDVTNHTSDIVHRNGFLYDKTNHTDVFDQDVEATVIYELTWDELPVSVQDYIALLTALRFLERYMPDDFVDSTLRDEVNSAKQNLDSLDLQRSDVNLFDNYRLGRLARRGLRHFG